MAGNPEEAPFLAVELDGLGDFRPFILDSWLGSYKRSRWAGCIPNNLYVPTHEVAIEQLLGRGAKVRAVVAKDAPDQLLAWVCYETWSRGLVVHYAYTKEIYRRNGLVKGLLADLGYKYGDPAYHTFRTQDSKYFPGFRWAPELVRRKTL